MELISHDWRAGVERLLRAPTDLPRLDTQLSRPMEKYMGSPQHLELFEDYVGLLDQVISYAVARWEGLVQARLNEGLTRKAALETYYSVWPAGPASLPQLVWVLRTFWLECAELNEQSPPDLRVPPQVFLLGWLIREGGHELTLQVLGGMPYWPIGLDADGNWV